MKKIFFISVVVCIFLIACREQKNIYTPKISLSPTLTETPTVTQIPKTKRPSTTTITPFPVYENKKVIFDYQVIGDHSVYDDFFVSDFPRTYSRLVLYSDGQMIIPSEGEFGGIYKQKMLSPDEIKQFFEKLEALGLYSLESNQKHDPTDQLYNYGDNYQKSFDGRLYCISATTEKVLKICVYEPDLQYLIPKMKNVLTFLGEYEPKDMTQYYPDRILLRRQAGRDPYNDNLPETSITWAENYPSLETSNPILYVDGIIAKEIYILFEDTTKGKVFIQNGKEFTVYIEVVLPHEIVESPHE